ncbi:MULTISPECIES: hypothetical protein [Hydrocarboniphaga]|uniref:Lipoprotein n=1 Tax=Hydrocarboniphaga effusa AP103 TaxID=1172194 RepID=I7ZD79_9GAMM|nr:MULTISPECIES: hypothetical protein [Hydrocarboniphaga]EIT69632.1 hypothetical protein WQQ_32140 [Hydrocarboniphaga effusa AP103]MDZ4080057.1 hypothetical protein [Hydrocarboniphaga sp.]
MKTLLPPCRWRLPAALVLFGLISACGGGGDGEPDSQVTEGIYEAVTPAVAGAPYAPVLADCAFNEARDDSCTLERLPFLGQETGSVTVDKLMERVVTSHPWMAQRFREVLQTLPEPALRMTRSLTAVVIGSKIRPSFYTTATGAIYLDPEYLWLTQAERATISDEEDYRAGFGNALQFVSLWRYVSNNRYAYYSYADSYTGTRSVYDIRLPIARLLFHELTHAGDYMPPAALDGLARNQTLRQAIDAQRGHRISDELVAGNPLASQTWKALADVLYRGSTASSAQRAMTPSEVADAFAPDRASDAYNYSTQSEDIAMMAEEALMQFHYGIERDIAFTNRPANSGASGDDYIVAWGVRGRVREPRVAAAAQFVLQRLLPGTDYSAQFANLPAPTPMRPGESWTTNLSASPDVPAAKSADAVPLPAADRLPPG